MDLIEMNPLEFRLFLSKSTIIPITIVGRQSLAERRSDPANSPMFQTPKNVRISVGQKILQHLPPGRRTS